MLLHGFFSKFKSSKIYLGDTRYIGNSFIVLNWFVFMFLTPEYIFIGLFVIIVIFLAMRALMKWAIAAFLVLLVYLFIKYNNLII